MSWTVYTLEYDKIDIVGRLRHHKEWYVLKSLAMQEFHHHKLLKHGEVILSEHETEDLESFINNGNYGIKIIKGGNNG